jgi:HSP20 family protein
MRSRFPTVTLSSEASHFGDDVRRIFHELDRRSGTEPLAGESSPAIDVYERDDSIEIVVDVPGVDAAALRVLARGDTVLIVGEKTVRRPRAESSFHLVERDVGRFARTVRVTRACDIRMAKARLAHGELHLSLPKIAERRGRAIEIRIDDSSSAQK